MYYYLLSFMKTRTWETLSVFDEPIEADNIGFIDSPLQIPEGMDEQIRSNWDKQLESKQNELQREGISTEIRSYHLDASEKPLNALYENDEPKMWPGPAISLKDVDTDTPIRLHVGQTYFPFIAALKDEEIRALYKQQDIPVPRPALAICTYALTDDGQLVLTVRGSRTNMYPGRFYGQGGNPELTNTNISDHQAAEMEGEILVKPNDYNPSGLRFTGIVVDDEQLPGKPDLVGWVPVNLESGEIKERVRKRPMNERPNDVIDVVFAPADETGLFSYLVNRTHPVQYCPPSNGGLVLYGHHVFGSDWSSQVLERLE